MESLESDPTKKDKIANKVYDCLDKQMFIFKERKRGTSNNPIIIIEWLRTPKTSFILEFHESVLEIKEGVDESSLHETHYTNDIDKDSDDICKWLIKFFETYNKDNIKKNSIN